MRAVGGSGSGIWSRRLLMSPWGGVRDPGTDRTRSRNIFLEQMSRNASVPPLEEQVGVDVDWTGHLGGWFKCLLRFARKKISFSEF